MVVITISSQNEMPYDPPTQATGDSAPNGYAAYKVAQCDYPQGWGMGSIVLNVNQQSSRRGFEVPVDPAGNFTGLLTGTAGRRHDCNVSTVGGPARDRRMYQSPWLVSLLSRNVPVSRRRHKSMETTRRATLSSMRLVWADRGLLTRTVIGVRPETNIVS